MKIEYKQVVYDRQKKLYDEIIEQMKEDFNPNEGFSFDYPSMNDLVPLDFALENICEDIVSWANSNGYYLETHKNEKLENIYNCNLKSEKQLNTNNCIKVFLHDCESTVIISAAKWLEANYKKVSILPILKDL